VQALRRHFARHGEWWWVPVVYALAVAWIYRGMWHVHGAATGIGWDTIDIHGSDLEFFARELREGRFSRWNPYDNGGYPIFCDVVFDRYYPFNWPFALWGALFGKSWWLVQIKVLAHHVAAGTCMHAFLRRRGLSARAALVGGIGLVASAPVLVHKGSNILWPLVWVPLVWLAIDFALARPSWRRGAAMAAAVLLPATAGSPPGLFYAMLLVVPYAIWRAVPAVRGKSRAERVQLAACAGVAAALVALVLALTVLPTSELVARAFRHRFDNGSDFALGLSLPFGPALRGVAVRGAGLFEMYCGASVVLLAACAVAVRPRFDRGAAIVFAAIAFAGVVLAAGTTAGVLPILVHHVPGFGLLRVPGRYKLLAAWSLAAAAGFGIGALEAAWREPQLRRRVLACAGGACVVTIACVIAWGRPADAKDRAAWWSIVATAVPAALACAAACAPKRWSAAALAAFVGCVLIDAPAFTFVEPGAPVAVEARQTHEHDADVIARMPGVSDRWRMYDEFVLGERAGSRLQARDFRGYLVLDPLSLRRYVDVLEFAKRDPAIITDYNVRWVLSRLHFRYGADVRFVKLPNRAFVARGGDLWEATAPAPLVAWYGAATVVASEKDVLAAVRAVQEPDGARRRAIVEPDDAIALPVAWLASGEPDSREGVVESYEPNEIRFSIDAPRAGLVVLNEVAFPGWEVRVDGAPAPPLRANYILRAVWVEAGHHDIAWRFEPDHWRTLVGGYALALAVIAAAAGSALRRARRRRAAT
jgi:hypothetical protein